MPGSGDESSIPLAIWLLVGAAAIAAAAASISRRTTAAVVPTTPGPSQMGPDISQTIEGGDPGAGNNTIINPPGNGTGDLSNSGANGPSVGSGPAPDPAPTPVTPPPVAPNPAPPAATPDPDRGLRWPIGILPRIRVPVLPPFWPGSKSPPDTGDKAPQDYDDDLARIIAELKSWGKDGAIQRLLDYLRTLDPTEYWKASYGFWGWLARAENAIKKIDDPELRRQLQEIIDIFRDLLQAEDEHHPQPPEPDLPRTPIDPTPHTPNDPTPDQTDEPAPDGEQPGGQPGGERPGTSPDPNAPEQAPPPSPDDPEPQTPPELPRQRPPSDHTTDPIHPDDPPFGEPPQPDGPGEDVAPGRPRFGEPRTIDQFIGQIFTIIAQLLVPPDPPDPNTDLNPDGTPTDQYVEDAIGELAQQVADLAAAYANEITQIVNRSAQGYGSGVHKIFEELIQSELNDMLQDLFGDEYAAHAEASILKTMGLVRNRGSGQITWAPKGMKGTVRPDLIVTKMTTTTVNGAKKTTEEIILIIDLKTGNAEVSKAWRTAVIRAAGAVSAIISSVTPDPRLAQPPKSTPPTLHNHTRP